MRPVVLRCTPGRIRAVDKSVLDERKEPNYWKSGSLPIIRAESHSILTIAKSLMLWILLHRPSIISCIESDVQGVTRHAADFIPSIGKRDKLVAVGHCDSIAKKHFHQDGGGSGRDANSWWVVYAAGRAG